MQQKSSLIIVLAMLAACSMPVTSTDQAAKIADAFVRAYYVDTDINKALSYCDGLACDTLNKELVLRESQKISSDTKRPHISAKQIKILAEEGGAKRFLYELTVKPSGIDPFQRESYVKLRPSNGTWKVTQFAEMKTSQ